MDAELAPWWLAIGGGIVSTLLSGIGILWRENQRLKRELDTAHEQIAHVQAEGFRQHRGDLRRLVGLPTSLEPGPVHLDPLRPPVLVREAAPKRRPAKKIAKSEPP